MGNVDSKTLRGTDVMVHEKSVTTKIIASANVRTALDELLSVIRDQNTRSIVGMELCSTITYTSNATRRQTAELLVLCSGNLCLLIRLRYLGYTSTYLASFLDLPELTFVGLGMKDTCKKLQTDHGLEVRNAVDLAIVAQAVKPHHVWNLTYPCGLYEMVDTMFGVHLGDKAASVVLGNWRAVKHDVELIKYATYDGYSSFAVGFRLMFDDNRFSFNSKKMEGNKMEV